MLDLSIIMPCLNEAQTIGICIQKARESIARLGLDGEIVVADNGSTDGSVKIAAQLGARVLQIEAKGYGNALRGGIEAAQGKWIIMGDADDSYDFGNIAPFVEKLQDGFDLVMGCRLPRGGRADHGGGHALEAPLDRESVYPKFNSGQRHQLFK